MATDLHRRDVLGALGGAAALSVAGAPAFAAAKATSLPFLAVGDWGRDGASHQRDVAMRMGRAAEAIDAGFVLSVGDNFYSAGVRSVSDPQWRTSFEDVYTAASLQKPWHVALGNHDYRGSPQAQIDYSRTSPRWRMPARYYKLSGADLGAPQVDFFCIDTSPMVSSYRQEFDDAIQANVASQDVDAQLAWLEGELSASKAPWKLVFGHHTVFSGGSTHGNTPELVARLKPILERHGVQAYINGHDHDLQHIQVAGVNYVCTGAGSEVRPVSAIPGTRFCLSRSGFSLYRLGLEALDLEFRDYLGATVYRAVLPRQGGAA
ncbi:MAG: tartrate-resistant acid phosphatase type 5 family protein [Caulobacteraceae bacterium]|nr:tartrate-resistant acid phosphatase type 5 family protein [Caulobacteraceae bacterium]